ncbi:unnamed protein product [Phytophthora lilii]|uniref:Unnamed protein product n=1 Tax=Phytophthora lilii TaxID=2077276 RepID=A0A9W6TTF0_9STRA|nr:unnamed protein product [Phytophthora lilii]
MSTDRYEAPSVDAPSEPDAVSPAPVKKRRKKRSQRQQLEAPVGTDSREAISQQTVESQAVEEEEGGALVGLDAEETRNLEQHQSLLSGYSEQEAARVHQKLVLACVLNDVQADFVEDEALMEAFAVARPGLPRLSAEHAKSTVLQELADDATKKMKGELAQCEVLTLVHRHFKKQGATPSRWCNQWTGVDEHRKVVPLKESYREVELSSSLPADEDYCRYCASREELDTVASTYRLSLGSEAVFCLCSECPLMYQQLRLKQQAVLSSPAQDADSASAITANSQILLSTCLLRQSLVLRKELLNTFPAVVDLLNKAIFLGHSLSKITPLRSQLKSLLPSSNWDAVPRLVKRMVYLEEDIRRYQAKVSVPAEEVSSFWNKLRVVDKLLTPFNWMLALSEAKETTSGQYMVLWIWVLAIVESTISELLPDEDKEDFMSAVMSLIGRTVDTHELVCMLLDPRVAGAGLSISGKRRVKSLVVQVAERVFPSEGYSGGPARSQLLTQLGDYVEKSESFADVVAWEMSAGRPAKLFWNDFVEDAPHLARVARAVISVAPCAQTATASLNSLLPTKESVWEQTFAVRQLKFLAQQKQNRHDCGVGQYRSLLFPPAPNVQGSVSDGALSAEVDKVLRATSAPRWSASVESEVDASVTHQLSLMLKVGGDSETEGEGEQAPSTPTAVTAGASSVGASWFAFHSPADRQALERAVKNFLPCPVEGTAII